MMAQQEVKTKVVSIGSLRFDEELYPRKSGADWKTIQNYYLAMKSGQQFPPIAIATVDGQEHTVIDGWHRAEAYKRLRRKEIEVEVLPAMTEAEAIVEATRRNIAHGRPLAFRDKLDVYRKLRNRGYKLDLIVSLLHIPRRDLRRYVASRLTVGATGQEVQPKPAVRHVGEEITEEEQEVLGGDTQLRLVKQLILILEKGWLETKDEKLVEAIGELKRLLRHVRTAGG